MISRAYSQIRTGLWVTGVLALSIQAVRKDAVPGIRWDVGVARQGWTGLRSGSTGLPDAAWLTSAREVAERVPSGPGHLGFLSARPRLTRMEEQRWIDLGWVRTPDPVPVVDMATDPATWPEWVVARPVVTRHLGGPPPGYRQEARLRFGILYRRLPPPPETS